MNDAIQHQTRRSRRELATPDMAMENPDPISMPGIDQDFDHPSEVVPATAEELQRDYADKLSFNEEPVTIIVHGSNEKNAQIVHDVWVNGKGAEVFVGGRWVEFHCIPVGIEVTTKRKYVEVLARKKTMSVRTEVIKHQDSEENKVLRENVHGCPFSVVEDRNPRGRQWLQDIMRERA